MNNFTLRNLGLVLILTIGSLHAVPLDANTDAQQPTAEITAAVASDAGDGTQNVAQGNQTELQAAASEQNTQNVAMVCTTRPNTYLEI